MSWNESKKRKVFSDGLMEDSRSLYFDAGTLTFFIVFLNYEIKSLTLFSSDHSSICTPTRILARPSLPVLLSSRSTNYYTHRIPTAEMPVFQGVIATVASWSPLAMISFSFAGYSWPLSFLLTFVCGDRGIFHQTGFWFFPRGCRLIHSDPRCY